jgi:hypothetical protein
MSDELPKLRALAEILIRAEASSRAECINPLDNPAYLYVKGRLLSGELDMDKAHSVYEAFFPTVNTEVIAMPADGKRNAASDQAKTASRS